MNGTQTQPPTADEKSKPMAPSSAQKRRKAIGTWAIRLLKALVSAGLLYLLIRTMRADSLHAAIKNANPLWVLAAFLLVPVNLWLQGIRWHLLVRTELHDVRFGKVFTSFLGGLSLGLITPGRVGEVGRIYLLEAPSRVRLAGLHVLDKMYFVGAVGLLGPALLYFMPGFRDALPDTIRTGASVVVLLLPLLYFLFALEPRPLKSLLVAIELAIGAKGKALELLRAYDGVHARQCLQATGVTFLQFIVILTQFFLLSTAFQPVNWFTAAHTYMAALFVKTLLPISLGNLGVGEWAAVSFYLRYGIAETTGFSASLMLFGFNVLLPGLAGLAILNRERPAALLRRLKLIRSEAA